MPLRVASVFLGYVIYLLLEGPLAGRLLMWAGVIALDWAIIERFTTWRRDRLSLLLAGQALLGIGLLVAGAITVFR